MTSKAPKKPVDSDLDERSSIDDERDEEEEEGEGGEVREVQYKPLSYGSEDEATATSGHSDNDEGKASAAGSESGSSSGSSTGHSTKTETKKRKKPSKSHHRHHHHHHERRRDESEDSDRRHSHKHHSHHGHKHHSGHHNGNVKRVKKEKLPFKGAKTPFIIFSTQKRGEAKEIVEEELDGEARPGAEMNVLISRKLGAMWKGLSEEEQKLYKDEAATDRVRFRKEMDAFAPDNGSKKKKKQRRAASSSRHSSSSSSSSSSSGSGSSSSGSSVVHRKRDEDAPKKPKSGYMVFTQARYQRVRDKLRAKKGDEYRACDVIAELGRTWTDMDETKRKPYEDEAQLDKERFKKENALYKAEKKKQR